MARLYNLINGSNLAESGSAGLFWNAGSSACGWLNPDL
jgi:hypothetical protein